MSVYLVTGAGGGKAPAHFTDLDQAIDYARGLARAGLAVSVYREVVALSPNQQED